MLFVAVLKATAGTPAERIARRAQWNYPEGVKLVAEYWLQASDPDLVSVFEADSVAPKGRKEMNSARASRSCSSSIRPCFGTAETR